MLFEKSLEEGYAKIVDKDVLRDISKETVEKALKEIPENINKLKKYLKEIKI